MKQISITVNIEDEQWARLEKLRAEMDAVGVMPGGTAADMLGVMVRTAWQSQMEAQLGSMEGMMRRAIERKQREAQAAPAAERGEG